MGKTGFEEALNLTGFGKYNLLTFILSGSIIMGMAFETFSVAYLVPASACELETTSYQQGIMAAVPLIGIIATSHFSGYLADTRGRRKVLIISMGIGFLMGGLSAFSKNWIMFSVLKTLSCSAVSGAFALSITLLSETTPEARRSTLVILTSSVFLCSNGLMAILCIPVLSLKFSYYISFLNIHFNSWRLLTIIFCSPCALSSIGLIFSFESPKYLLNAGEEEKVIKILKAIFVINTKKSADEYPVDSVILQEATGSRVPTGFISSVIQQSIPLFKPPLLKNTLLLSLVFIIIYICIHPHMVWLPFMCDGFLTSVQRGDEDFTFCQRLRSSANFTTTDQDPDDCSLNSFAMTLVFAVAVMLAFVNTILSSIINIFGRKRLLIGFQFASGLAAICLNFTTIWQLSAVLMLVFISGTLNFGMLSSFSLDVFPTYVKAMGVCFTLMMGRGSAVFGVNAVKVLLDSHCETSFYVFGTLALLGGLLGFCLPGDKQFQPRRCPET